MTALSVSALAIHPVKGVRAASVLQARVLLRGLEGDRRWLIVDADGRFLSQRDCAGLARIIASPIAGGLRLSSDDGEAIDVETPAGDRRVSVVVWRDTVDAALADEVVNAWLSKTLDRAARLCFMDDRSDRSTSEKWGARRPTSFADAFPLLIVSEASLEALNTEIAKGGGAPVTMDRFRPNIVISGGDPWEEDYWARLRIGGVEIDVVKPCDRCLVTTLDPQFGAALGKEPLKTLAVIRRSADARVSGVLFGWNAAPLGEGEIAVGDRVDIIERREGGWPLATA
ncbi:MAG: MOSC domain-containing protein [Pseudomonadota bacterium]